MMSVGPELTVASATSATARVVDTRFYVQAIETGAFDFLAPPFTATDLAYVVRSALDNIVARRGARSHAAHTGGGG